jgi:hypothetical protein
MGDEDVPANATAVIGVLAEVSRAAAAASLASSPASSESLATSASRDRKESNRQRGLPRPPPPTPADATLIKPDDGAEEDDPAVLLARDGTGVLEGDAEYGV